jgi:hypothetical protein
MKEMNRFLFRAALLGTLGAMLASAPSITQGQTLPLTTSANGLSLHSAPTTLTLTPLPTFAPALRAAQDRNAPVILAIEGVVGQPVQPIRINVFVGKPDATAKTSTDDPHFVGYIAIAPKYGADKTRGVEVSRSFDVSNLDFSAQPTGMPVTLVPVAGIAEAPSDLTLTVRQITFRRGE